ncbi:MAG: RNA 2',3'-cyclic phosphodiesterase [Myxococcota bacterium]|nr:RNA 2',3'-cyclic phosphodiesterase [Myxococcota bacterium]
MRTFIGVELGQALRSRLEPALGRLARLAPQARWVRPDSLHLTLAFLGEVPDATVPRIGEGLLKVAALHPTLELGVRGSGIFGPLDSPKVLWTGLSGAVEGLENLQRAVVVELSPLGLAPDHQQFVPHITLARAKSPRGDPGLERCADTLRDADFGALRVEEVILFASQTDKQGMRYHPLASAVLGRR